MCRPHLFYLNIYLYMQVCVYKHLYVYTHIYIYLHIYMGEGNSTPLQYCCLENPMDREAW